MNKYSDYDIVYRKKHDKGTSIRSGIFLVVAISIFIGFVYVVNL